MSSIDSFTEAVRESLNAGEYSHLPTAEEEEEEAGETTDILLEKWSLRKNPAEWEMKIQRNKQVGVFISL